ncbi:NmrA family transcriptional regulator [Mycobacterium sp. MS1601]|uniref:NmrA family NAD(P)-binding protein n=1 Tax=Mycobacterium sp. MS1601 TaxID=1936029 RepID=UPI0009793B1F|nr:NAD(P)H-binding protein [Mycobacterium sp. MS1601]AQA04676.1 NmrA family transcriptional regulator [Mycobacterium sp. MS1601]
MITVTAPTGTIGAQVVDLLLDRGRQVRVVVRNPARLTPRVRDNVDIVEGSHSDADVIAAAFDGADTLFWLVPPDPRAPSVEAAYVDFAKPACAALPASGIQRVVGVSALGRGTPMADRAGYVTASLATDNLIASTGVAYRALTMPSFMDNLVRQAELISNRGVFFSPIAGDRAMPSCASCDIASTAVTLLTDASWNGVADVPVLGPADLSFDDMAAVMSQVLGRPVRYQQIEGPAFKETMLGHGMSDAMAQGMLDMAMAKNAGLDNVEPRTPENSTPTTFRQWCIDVLKPAVARIEENRP